MKPSLPQNSAVGSHGNTKPRAANHICEASAAPHTMCLLSVLQRDSVPLILLRGKVKSLFWKSTMLWNLPLTDHPPLPFVCVQKNACKWILCVCVCLWVDARAWALIWRLAAQQARDHWELGFHFTVDITTPDCPLKESQTPCVSGKVQPLSTCLILTVTLCWWGSISRRDSYNWRQALMDVSGEA